MQPLPGATVILLHHNNNASGDWAQTGLQEQYDHHQTMAGTGLAHRRLFIDRAHLPDRQPPWPGALATGTGGCRLWLAGDAAARHSRRRCHPLLGLGRTRRLDPVAGRAPRAGAALDAAYPDLAHPGALADALSRQISTPAFVTEYGVRPNRLYVEYLIYPKEVLSMLWAGRKGELLLAVIFSGAVLGGGWWLSGRLVRDLSFPPLVLAPRLRPADPRRRLSRRPLQSRPSRPESGHGGLCRRSPGQRPHRQLRLLPLLCHQADGGRGGRQPVLRQDG